MLSHERLTEVMKLANARRTEIREALEHHRHETKRLEVELQRIEGEFSMCVTLIKESIGAEQPQQPQSVEVANGQPAVGQPN